MNNYQHYEPIKINKPNYSLSLKLRHEEKLEYFRNLVQSLQRECMKEQWKDDRLNTMYDIAVENLKLVESES